MTLTHAIAVIGHLASAFIFVALVLGALMTWVINSLWGH